MKQFEDVGPMGLAKRMLKESDAKMRVLRDENILLRAQVNESKTAKRIKELEKEVEEVKKENQLLKRALDKEQSPSKESDTIVRLKKTVRDLMEKIEKLNQSTN